MPSDPFLNQSQDHGGPAVPSLKPGLFLFNRRYELMRPLGAGGMGVVWLARDHTEHTEVALKFLPTVLVLQETEMKRLRDEVRAGKELRHPGIVATYALEVEENAAAIVIAHNHPSGDPSPSAEDIHVTKTLKEAGKLLDIELLDHIVIGGARYVSMKERGLGFEA